MKIDIYKAKWNGKELEPVNIGYIELNKFDEDECWHLCNWSAWSEIKPDNLHSKITVCNTDVIFHNPENDMYYTPGSTGWNEPLPMLDACVVYWLNDFSTLIMSKSIYDYLNKNDKTFEEVYCIDSE